MLGLGQSLSHGGAPSGPIKLVISNPLLTAVPNDSSVYLRATISEDMQSIIGTSTTSQFSQYPNLTASVTMNRVSAADGTVAESGTATLNVFKHLNIIPTTIFLTDATGTSTDLKLTGAGGGDTLNLATSFSTDLTIDDTQFFRVDIILNGTGFESSDSVSNSVVQYVPPTV